jgi:hypothetical protein
LCSAALLLGACATQSDQTVIDKRFERVAKQYQQYQYEGQVIYCKRGATRSLPPTECVTEAALRERVDEHQRSRNGVVRGGPPYVATVPGGQ